MSKFPEEIKASTVNKCECETCYCDNFTLQWIAVEPEHFDWLIEQAGRVGRLENEVDQDNRQSVLEGLYEQNKHYREAITESINELYVRNVYDNDEAINTTIDILNKALEETK